MKRSGPPPIYPASAETGKVPVGSSEQGLLSLLETLEECRAALMDMASHEAARLLSLAMLEIQMEIHNVTDAELKALCDLMTPEDLLQQDLHQKDLLQKDVLQDAKDRQGHRLPSYLKLIK